MKRNFAAAALVAALYSGALRAAPPTEIVVDLKLDEISYVSGEKVKGTIDVKNMSPDVLEAGREDSPDILTVEIYRASDHSQLERAGALPFTKPFKVQSNEGVKLETDLAACYGLDESRRYLARPVLVHGGYRFEGRYRAFDVVPGMKVSSAMQMFAGRKAPDREFELLRWSRKGCEHLFLAARDLDAAGRRWYAVDVGPVMRITKPTISILPDGTVVVIHRNGPDSFVRSEFWSLPDALEFRSRTMVLDPETAGQTRVREIYAKDGEVKPVSRPWWKIW